MKKTFQTAAFSLLFGVFLFVSMGCPAGLEYPLDEPGTVEIDPELIGTWIAEDESAEMLKVKVSKKDNYTLFVEVLESSENYLMDVSTFDAWVTTFEGKNFLFAKPDDGSEESYYHYNYEIENGNLVIQDISLLVNGTDGVSDMESLRKEVAASLKLEGCLTGPLLYSKE